MARTATIPTDKRSIRKLIGQKGRAVPFTAADLAQGAEVTVVTARKHLERLAEAGVVQPVGLRKTGLRGRPAHLFEVTKGK